MKIQSTKSSYSGSNRLVDDSANKKTIASIIEPSDLKKEFRNIFNELIGKYLEKTLVYRYNSVTKNHSYTPYRHDLNRNTEIVLAEYMRKYIYFYAYSEKEVIIAYKNKRLEDLELASQRALRERLPNRQGSTNGLYSELLFDLFINLFYESNKLATRTIYRQKDDNQEIKGFDGVHFILEEGKKEIWLGQAKMGSVSYCTRDILNDLNNKANIIYSSKQLYFIADKEKSVFEPAMELLNSINNISWKLEGLSEEERANQLEEYFIKENIKILCPCLLAYQSDLYESEGELENRINSELEYMISKFDNEFKTLFRSEYEVLIWIFPIRDLNAIRDNMLNNYGTNNPVH